MASFAQPRLSSRLSLSRCPRCLNTSHSWVFLSSQATVGQEPTLLAPAPRGCRTAASGYRKTGSSLALRLRALPRAMVLGGSWDLVSKVISALIGIILMVTLFITLVTKSHDPPSDHHGGPRQHPSRIQPARFERRPNEKRGRMSQAQIVTS